MARGEDVLVIRFLFSSFFLFFSSFFFLLGTGAWGGEETCDLDTWVAAERLCRLQVFTFKKKREKKRKKGSQ